MALIVSGRGLFGRLSRRVGRDSFRAAVAAAGSTLFKNLLISRRAHCAHTHTYTHTDYNRRRFSLFKARKIKLKKKTQKGYTRTEKTTARRRFLFFFLNSGSCRGSHGPPPRRSCVYRSQLPSDKILFIIIAASHPFV